MTVLTKIMERLGVRQADAETKYAGFVSDTATGCNIDDARLFSAITAAGKTLEQFVADVSRIERREGAKLKLEEAKKLKPACEAACKVTGEAMNAVNDVRAKAQQAIGDAIREADAKSEISNSLQRQIRDLERQASEDLQATADPGLQAEIDQLEARCRDARYEGNSINVRCDPNESAKRRMELGEEEHRLLERIEELKRQQLAG